MRGLPLAVIKYIEMNCAQLIAIIVIFVSTKCYAQSNISPIEHTKFELVNKKYVFLKALINKKDTLTFLFDTGATLSVLDKNTAKRIGVNSIHDEEIEGLGEKKTYQIAKNQEISIGNVLLDSIEFVLHDLAFMKKSVGYSFDGIIGYPILDNYVTAINFDKREMSFYSEISMVDVSSYSEHSFAMDKDFSVPQIEIEIQFDNLDKHNGIILFDSGAALSLIINSPFAEKIGLYTEIDKKNTSAILGLGSSASYQKIRLKSLKFCGYDFPNILAQLASTKSGVSSYKEYLGILGAEIINRFNIVLDYSRKKLYLSPSKLY